MFLAETPSLLRAPKINKYFFLWIFFFLVKVTILEESHNAESQVESEITFDIKVSEIRTRGNKVNILIQNPNLKKMKNSNSEFENKCVILNEV